METKYMSLFQSIRIGGIEVKNRIIMPPMDTNSANLDGTVSPSLLPYMRNRAKGGAGLIIQECANPCWPMGKNGPREIQMNDNRAVNGLHDMTNVVHSFGTKIILQLNHAGFQANPVYNEGMQPVGPSESDVFGTRTLGVDEIQKIVQQFIDASFYAKLAGYDGIELHAAHGYLLNAFLSPITNKREDLYGGNLENSFRIIKEMITGIREKCGKPFIISVRMPMTDPKGGFSLEDAAGYCKMAEDAGADMINCSTGLNPDIDQSPTQWAEEGMYLFMTEAAKKMVTIPVALVGKMHTPEMCAQVLDKKQADLICIGRQLLCDPEWPNKILQNRVNEIRPCLSCFDGCMNALMFRNESVRCSINPYVGFEYMKSENSVGLTNNPKKILVIGGGIAGMQFSIISKKRGNKVILVEESSELGGQMILAGMTPHKESVQKALKWFKEETIRCGVDVQLNTKADTELIHEIKPDIVVIATGMRFALPKLDGIENAYNGEDVLSRKIEVGSNKNVVIIGGGVVGSELAHRICMEGSHVTIMEMMPDICVGGEFFHSRLLKDYLHKNAKVLTSVSVKSICKDSVEYVNENNETIHEKADMIIVCAGQKKIGTDLYHELTIEGIETYCIGNNEKASNFLNSTRSAFELAYTI